MGPAMAAGISFRVKVLPPQLLSGHLVSIGPALRSRCSKFALFAKHGVVGLLQH